MWINGLTFQMVGIVPKIDLGITWECVGGVMHPVDYGASTTHVSTTLTAVGTPSDMASLRNTLEGANGNYFGFHVESGEPIWGIAFDYSTSKASSWGCSASDIGEVQNVNGVQCSLTFTLHAIDAMEDAVLSYSQWPSSDNMFIESYSNSKDRKTQLIKTMSRFASPAFLWESPSVTVNYIMKQSYASRFMAYMYKLRSGYLTLYHPTDIFGDGGTTHAVYCVGYPSATPLDKGGNYYKIQVNYVQRFT